MKREVIQFVIGTLLLSKAIASQTEVDTSGVGVAKTKVEACELALDQARREAAQAATSVVQSTFSSIANDNGVSHASDQVLTSKAFAKLVDKKEKASFDSDSGLIRCEVTARFKAGYVTSAGDSNMGNQVGSSLSNDSAAAFRTGEPFCSRIMDMCFREVYSPQLGEFGIQVLPSKEQREKYLSSFMDANGYNMFFNRIKKYPHSKESKEINNQKSLLEYIKARYDESSGCKNCVAIPTLFVNQYKWSDDKGFKGGSFSPLMNQKMALGPRSMEVSEKYLEELDKLMNNFYQDSEGLN